MFPRVFDLETRRLPSAFPPNVLSSTIGEVTQPGQVDNVTTVVNQKNLTQGRPDGTVLGVYARATPGSRLKPSLLDARDAQGHVLHFQGVAPFVRGRSMARAFVRVTEAGPFRVALTGADATKGPFEVKTRLLGDLNGDGVVDFQDLSLFPSTYLSRMGGPRYNPNADATGSGKIGIFDGRALVRNMTPPGPTRHLAVTINLDPKDSFQGRGPQNSGGDTLKKKVTILGHTTPGSIVFTDTGEDFSFRGQALATDPQGRFSIKVENRDGVNQHQFLVIDPWGQQTIRSFPIRWMNFGRDGG